MKMPCGRGFEPAVKRYRADGAETRIEGDVMLDFERHATGEGRMRFAAKINQLGTRVPPSQDAKPGTLQSDVTRKVIQTIEGLRKLASVAASIRHAVTAQADAGAIHPTTRADGGAVDQSEGGGAPDPRADSHSNREEAAK